MNDIADRFPSRRPAVQNRTFSEALSVSVSARSDISDIIARVRPPRPRETRSYSSPRMQPIWSIEEAGEVAVLPVRLRRCAVQTRAADGDAWMIRIQYEIQYAFSPSCETRYFHIHIYGVTIPSHPQGTRARGSPADQPSYVGSPTGTLPLTTYHSECRYRDLRQGDGSQNR